MTDKENLPKDIVLIKDFPPFTNETSFTLNSAGDKYERELMLPFIDDKFETLSEHKIYLSFDSSAYRIPLMKSYFVTKEEFGDKKFNDYKIQELERLIEELKKLR